MFKPLTKYAGAAAGLLLIAAVVGACSSSGSTGGGPYGAPAAVAGATQVAAAPPAAGTVTLMAKTLGSQTILVAGSNGMTVYTFANDTAGSGKSACNGGCLTTWPALTVPAGVTPTAGAGVSGKIGTISAADGTLLVTYNGLPLHFFSGDKAAGDTNGSYPNWNLVKP